MVWVRVRVRVLCVGEPPGSGRVVQSPTRHRYVVVALYGQLGVRVRVGLGLGLGLGLESGLGLGLRTRLGLESGVGRALRSGLGLGRGLGSRHRRHSMKDL